MLPPLWRRPSWLHLQMASGRGLVFFSIRVTWAMVKWLSRILRRSKQTTRGMSVDWLKVSDVPGDFPQVMHRPTAKADRDVLPLMSSGLGEFAQQWLLEPLNQALLQLTNWAPQSVLPVCCPRVDGFRSMPHRFYVDGTHLFYRTDCSKRIITSRHHRPGRADAAVKKPFMEGEDNPQLYGFVSMWAKFEGLVS